MSTGAIMEHVASDGARQTFRRGAENEGPRPIDDKELEAVAGGANFRVNFADGCVIYISGVDNWDVASHEAVDIHSFGTCTNHDHTVTAL